MTVSFRDILWGVANMSGMTPQLDGGLPLPEASQITECINMALRYCWNRYDWPPLCPTLEVPVLEHARGSRYVRHEDAFETVFATWMQDPAVRSGRSLELWQDPDGYHLPPGTVADVVWMRGRPAAPRFSAVDYRAEDMYVAGDVVYFEPARDCFRAKTSATQGTSPPDVDTWKRLVFPPFLAEPVKAAAHALFQLPEGQYGTAGILASSADTLLDEEQDRFEFQQGHQHKPWRK